MEWDWNFVWEILPRLFDGVQITILATALGFALACVLGLVITLLKRSRHLWISWPVTFVADFIRGTPLLVQLYFLFFVLPSFGITLHPLVAGVLGLGLHNGTYIAEVYRAGIESIPKGQWEAAKACNLTRLQSWRYIVLPQAIPPMIPALSNYLIAMFKETPLLSAITVYELMGQARGIATTTFRYNEPITLVGLFFLIISLVAAYLTRILERRMRVDA